MGTINRCQYNVTAATHYSLLSAENDGKNNNPQLVYNTFLIKKGQRMTIFHHAEKRADFIPAI